MNDRQLKYIITIANEKNITSAAKKLYIAQPSLSNLLDHVESELGVKLFYRSAAGMQLTDAGDCYVRTAKSILSSLSNMDLRLSEIRSEQRGHLSVGCSTKKSGLLFPVIIPRMRKEFPLYQFQLCEEPMSVLTERLLTGELDIAFLYSDYNLPHIKSVPFSNEEICILAPTAFDSPDIEALPDGHLIIRSFRDLEGKPFVLFKKGRHLRKLADEVFRNNSFTPNVILETENWQTCLAMAECGEGFTMLPVTSIEMESYRPVGALRTKVIRPNGVCLRSLSIYYRESLEGTRVLDEFLKCCFEADRKGSNEYSV